MKIKLRCELLMLASIVFSFCFSISSVVLIDHGNVSYGGGDAFFLVMG